MKQDRNPVSTTVQLSSLYDMLPFPIDDRGEKADPFRWCQPTQSMSQVVTYSQLTEQSQPSFLQIFDTIASVPRTWKTETFKEVRHLLQKSFWMFFLLLLFVLWWESLKHLGVVGFFLIEIEFSRWSDLMSTISFHGWSQSQPSLAFSLSISQLGNCLVPLASSNAPTPGRSVFCRMFA